MSWLETRERLAVDLVRWLPKGTFGRAVGFWARRHIPRPLRPRLYRRFARAYGINLDEVERPLDEYTSFDGFFTRHLRAGARPIDPDPAVVVSPVDGTVVESGLAAGGRLIQAKGLDYTLRALLIDEDTTACFAGGSYVTLYLAPRDYHRIHAPADGSVTGYRHVPGAFCPVGPASGRRVAGRFARNERLVTYLATPLGRMAVVKVAATGVGHVTVTYDTDAQTRQSRRTRRVDYPVGKPIRKGEELGTFHLGSTVIVLFEQGRVALAPLERGQRVQLGQPIGRRAAEGTGEV